MPRETLVEMFQRAIHEHGPRVALRSKEASGGWSSTTYAQFGRLVEEAALGLAKRGVEAGDRVGIIAENRPEWAIADFAMLHAGAVSTPIYPTLRPEQVAYIVEDAGVEVLFVEGAELLDLVLEAAPKAEGLRELILLEDDAVADEGELTGELRSLITLEDLYTEGQEVAREDGTDPFEERWQAVEPDDLATLIYTSGTTGNPKGVKLSHGNITSNIEAFVDIIRERVEPGARYLSFLPLSHSFERIPGHFALYREGVEVWFAESIETVPEDLQTCRPHLMLAVPRLFEKMHERVNEAVADAAGHRRALYEWATGVSERVADRLEAGRAAGGLLGIQRGVADALVLSKLRARLGLDQLELAFSGGAALDPEVAEWFWSIGIELYEGYGQTEASPVISVNRPDAFKLGTVGKVLPNVDVRIDEEGWDGPAGEGEILARGPNVMQGYWNLPDVTEATITRKGWLRTGDVGQFDDDGFLLITDRKKELFKTAYGKYIAPEHVARLLKRSNLVDQVLVVGEERKYVAALIAPNFETLEAWAKEHDVDVRTRQELVEHPRVQERFEAAVEAANEELPRYEQVKRFTVLGRTFEVGEELTPTLKIKRRVVEERFADEIDALYPTEDA